MEERVEESEQTEQAAKSHQPVQTRNLPDRRNGQSHQQKDERQHSGSAGNEFEGIRAGAFVINVPNHQRERHEGVDEEDELGEARVFHKSVLEIPPQVHSLIKPRHLIAVTVEKQRVARGKARFADPMLFCLAPSTVGYIRINV